MPRYFKLQLMVQVDICMENSVDHAFESVFCVSCVSWYMGTLAMTFPLLPAHEFESLSELSES